MTLFIACLLIFNFGMEWWWYGIAVILWGIRMRMVLVAADMKFERQLHGIEWGIKNLQKSQLSWNSIRGELYNLREQVRDVRYAVRDEVRDARICRAPPIGHITIKD